MELIAHPHCSSMNTGLGGGEAFPGYGSLNFLMRGTRNTWWIFQEERLFVGKRSLGPLSKFWRDKVPFWKVWLPVEFFWSFTGKATLGFQSERMVVQFDVSWKWSCIDCWPFPSWSSVLLGSIEYCPCRLSHKLRNWCEGFQIWDVVHTGCRRLNVFLQSGSNFFTQIWKILTTCSNYPVGSSWSFRDTAQGSG